MSLYELVINYNKGYATVIHADMPYYNELGITSKTFYNRYILVLTYE